MDSRRALVNGFEIHIGEEVLTVVEVEGRGASCITYRVVKHFDGIEIPLLMKECFPFGEKVSRTARGELVWEDEKVKQNMIARFRKSYETLAYVYSCMTNSTSMPFNFFEENGTVYYCTNILQGTTFAKDTSIYLDEVLKTCLSVTNIIEQYHEMGYLYLDVKAENVFVLDNVREIITLFDMDSIVSKKELKEGKIKYIPFSENNVAPEQRKGEFSKIDEKTDVYAIGAMLFKKIMRRNVEYFDRELFADWKLDDLEMFKAINPKVKTLIKEIFHGTLANNTKRRFSIRKLAEAFKEVIKVCKEPYLISFCPGTIEDFVGRGEELKKMHECISECNNVFVNGMHGIGKTEFVKEYASQHKGDYSTVIFCHYESTLKKVIEKINIYNFDPEKEKNLEEREMKLRELLDENTLLIVDNFDVDEDEYLSKFLNYNCKKIITTTHSFGEYKNTRQFSVSQMPDKELKDIFLTELKKGIGHYKWEVEDDKYFAKILNKIDRLTIFLPILACQCAESGWSVKTLFLKISDGLDSLKEETESVYMYKDGDVTKNTVPKITRVIFDISKLDNKQKKVLCNLSLLQFMYVNKAEYRRIALYGSEKENLNSFNKTVKSGWVKVIHDKITGETYYELHPIINELIRNDFAPDSEKCPEVFAYVNDGLHYDDEVEGRYFCLSLEEKHQQILNNYIRKFVYAFLTNVTLKSEKNVLFVVKQVKNKNIEHMYSVDKIYDTVRDAALDYVNDNGIDDFSVRIANEFISMPSRYSIQNLKEWIELFKRSTFDSKKVSKSAFKKLCFHIVDMYKYSVLKNLFDLDEYSKLLGEDWEEKLKQKQMQENVMRSSKKIKSKNIKMNSESRFDTIDKSNNTLDNYLTGQLEKITDPEQIINIIVSVIWEKDTSVEFSHKRFLTDRYIIRLIDDNKINIKHVCHIKKLLEHYSVEHTFLMKEEMLNEISYAICGDVKRFLQYLNNEIDFIINDHYCNRNQCLRACDMLFWDIIYINSAFEKIIKQRHLIIPMLDFLVGEIEKRLPENAEGNTKRLIYYQSLMHLSEREIRKFNNKYKKIYDKYYEKIRTVLNFHKLKY